MKPIILKVFSTYPDNISFDLKKNDENHLIRISDVENQNIPQIKCELLNNNYCDNIYSNDGPVNDSNRDVSVLEDYYRFQERRNAFIDSKKCILQQNQSQQKRVFERPNFSYTQLIYMAIESSALKALTVNDIYTWCELNFPYYANAIHGWKNSLRHNLSINKCFKKITKMGQGGRGSLWIVDPREKQHLVSTMHRSNVTSFSTPSFIIQTAPPPAVEHPKIVSVIEDQSMELPQEDTVISSEDLHVSELYSDFITLPEEKPSYSWTDTRLPYDYKINLSPDNCSHGSDTDFNDWKRTMISLEPIYPIKQHQFTTPVTPHTSEEHNYSVSYSQIDCTSSSVAQQIFQSSVHSETSCCTSSDYNDEEWPRTPSPPPVPQIAHFTTVNHSQQLQIKHKNVKSGSKQGRRNSAKRENRSKAIKKEPINQNERINNMYNLNTFINSL